jgi:hypothetical protein
MPTSFGEFVRQIPFDIETYHPALLFTRLAEVPVGSRIGVVDSPYLLGERVPHFWNANARRDVLLASISNTKSNIFVRA